MEFLNQEYFDSNLLFFISFKLAVFIKDGDYYYLHKLFEHEILIKNR